jgi:citrate synthase
MEMHEDPDFKIGRPRQVYTGPRLSRYVELDQRPRRAPSA